MRNKNHKLREIISSCLIFSFFTAVLLTGGVFSIGDFGSKENLAQAQVCKPVDVILVIDKSGSMAGKIFSETQTKMEAAKESSSDFIDLLGANDHIGIVSFSDSAFLNQQLTDDKTLAKNAVDSLTPGGGTWTDKGIGNAWVEFDDRGRGDSPHEMIILTDGKPDAVLSAQNQSTIAKNKGIKMIVIGYDIGSTVDPAGTRTILIGLASTPGDYCEAPTTVDLQNIYNQLAAQMCDSNPPVITGPGRSPSSTVFPGDQIKLSSTATDNQASDWGLESHRIYWTSNNWTTTDSCDSGLTPGVKINNFECSIGPFPSDIEIKYRSYVRDLALFEADSSIYSFKVATVTITVTPDILERLIVDQVNTITAQISDPQGKANLDKYYIEVESPSDGAIKVSKTEMVCGGTGSLFTCTYSFTPLSTGGWSTTAKILIYPWDTTSGFHNAAATKQVDVVSDITPPVVTISHSPDPVLNTDIITLTSVAGDISGLQSQKIFYWINGGAKNTYNCDDVAPQDGKCDIDPSKNIGNFSINIGPYSANTIVEYQAEATDNWGNTALTSKPAITVISAECHNADRTQKPALTPCTGGKCCAGLCATVFTCSMDDECRQEICSGMSWICQAANLGANCLAGTSGDDCYSYPSCTDYGGGGGCEMRDYSCDGLGQCVYSYYNRNCDSCDGIELRNYRCFGGSCDFEAPKIRCSEDDNRDGDSILCNCNCAGYDVVESIFNGNCTDNKDNDCDGVEDCHQPACDISAPTTLISAYDNKAVLIPNGGDVVDTDTNKVRLDVSSFENAPCPPNPNVLSRVKVFYNVDSGSWNLIFDCADTSPQDGKCDSDPSKNIGSFSVEIPVAGFSAGTKVGYRSEATDSAPVPNTGYVEGFFNVISAECKGQPDLTVCTGGKCCTQVCDTSYECSLDSDCLSETCIDNSWSCGSVNEGGGCLSTAWAKYKAIIIDNSNNPSTLTNYQVKLTIPYDSDMQSDFDDLRFVDKDGNTLNYWLESKSDGVSVDVWVKVPSIPASSKTTIYVYYGNPTASSASNGKDTFIAFDWRKDGAFASETSSGYYHTCALLSNETGKCWGYNGYGQLGDGTTTNRTTPVSVSGLTNAVGISSGYYHTCSLLSDGTAKCWGYNGYGQLGDGTTTNKLTPVNVSGLSNAVAIAAGYYHTCALLSDGTAKCWGYNGYGQLGDGTTTNKLVPVNVSGLSNAVAIAAGYYHTCALLSDGTAKCWGYNGYGQLGDGTTTNKLTPVNVSGLSNAVAITNGIYHTCSLLSDGTAKCWGYNGYGQLGDGTTTNKTIPISVSGLVSAVGISSDGYHTCSLLSDGTAKCWGYNGYGQLGDGTTTNKLTPVSVSGLSNAVEIITVRYHTCSLLSDGTAKCWGYNGYGQLGDGTTTSKTTPVSVSSYNLGGRYDRSRGIYSTPIFSDKYFVRKYTSPEPTLSLNSEQEVDYSAGCFPFDTGCQQKGGPLCNSGYCNISLSQYPDYCDYGTSALFDYGCNVGNCQLLSSNPSPWCDTQPPTASLEARDNTDAVITDGAEVLPSLTNKVTLSSVAFDNYALQSHQLQYRKNGGAWETCEDLDKDGNYDAGECTNADASFNLAVVSLSLASISIKIGPFNNGDIIEYRTIAADTAQPVPYSTTVQKSFISKIPNNIPTVTPISPPIIYPNGSDYWKGEDQEADCWRSLQTVVSWTYNDIDGNCQRAYQVEDYSDPGFTTLVKDSCNGNNTGTCLPCSDTGGNCEPCGTSCSFCSTSSAYTITSLDWNKTYWWRVRVFDGEDWSSWQIGDSFTTPLHLYPTADFTYNPASPDIAEQITFTQSSKCYTTTNPSTSVNCGSGTTKIKHIGWDFYRMTNTQPNPPNVLGESLNVSIDNSDGIDPDLDYNYTYYSTLPYPVYLEIEDQDGYVCSFIEKVIIGGMKYPWWREILPR